MVSREEVTPSVLVCPGTWKLRTRQGWDARNVIEGPASARTHLAIVMTSGQKIRRLVGVNWK